MASNLPLLLRLCILDLVKRERDIKQHLHVLEQDGAIHPPYCVSPLIPIIRLKISFIIKIDIVSQLSA